MPFVRISLNRQPGDFARQVGEQVQQAMIQALGIPAGDRFHVITQHGEGELVYDPSFLDVERTDGIIFIQITLATGRDREAKTTLYQAIAGRLSAELAVRPEDVFITLLEVPVENFSFGNGEAQFADRLPPHLARTT
ncbi:tautomerase family protein [Nonomuraea sp. B5E05]|uniref:tautomerase family protein n=1 Tax=Nonomuraea sp. B5E05 TaxID=3153569 RepID=UPI00326135E2